MIGVGSMLAGYRLDSVVGRGATASVYAATELADARRVALKLLAPQLRGQAAVRDRFLSAARLQQSLEHPSVLAVEDVLESGDEALIVMRLVSGGTLAELIAGGTLTAGRTLHVVRQVADALDFAHGAGVVHGDVKPRNVLVDEGDVAYLADFGLATAVSQVASAPASPGTIDYSAPERLRGEPPTPSADLYALACVLFECLTGVAPYSHDAAAAVVGGHLYNAPPRPSELVPQLPAELDAILARGLAKDPAERPRSAQELVDAAAAVLEGMAPFILSPPPRRAEAGGTRRLDDTLVDPVPVLPAAPVIELGEAGFSWRVAMLAALILALSAVAGLWLGLRSPDSGESRLVGLGPLAVSAPSEWKAVAAPQPSELGLDHPFVLVPRERPRSVTLAVGSAGGVHPAFVAARSLQIGRAHV